MDELVGIGKRVCLRERVGLVGVVKKVGSLVGCVRCEWRKMVGVRLCVLVGCGLVGD